MIAPVLYIVVLQFSSGKTMFIKNAYKRRSVLIAQNADVARTSVGVTYLSFMKCVKIRNVLYMLTTEPFVHGKQTSTFACHCLVMGKRLLLRSTILALSKQ